MKFSYEWLASLVDLKAITPAQVAKALNGAGIEVESVEPLVRATNITTGLVLTREMIEGSDHLSKVTVDTGHHGLRTIVCGAPNIRAGQKVLVALPGAILPKVTIQASVIKGVASEGMVCALDELGVDKKFLTDDQVNGIEVLANDTAIGDDDILLHLGLTDTIFTLKLLANRPDLWSLEGIAYEVSALLQRPLTLMQTIKETTLPKPAFVIDIQTEKTKQFSIRVLKGVQQTSTPGWMKQRLIASGIRPLSFFVDLGNYVMLLTGQPLHLYDLDKLPTPQLTLVDQWQQPFVALDGKTYPLQSGDITILSQQQVMCLAGVMGAQACAVDDATTNLAIEAAAFDATSIRKTSTRLGLVSDASIRFAKAIDLSQFDRVLSLTTQLLKSLTTVAEVYETLTVNRLTLDRASIRFKPQDINRLLGTAYDNNVITDTLTRLAIRMQKDGEDLLATPPNHRQDLLAPADLAEEIIRLKGFADIQNTVMPSPVQAGGYDELQEKVRLTKTYFTSQGLDAVLTYTLIEKQWTEAFQLLDKRTNLILKNPLSEERQHVRTHVLGSLIQVVQYNLARQVNAGRIFEISQVSYPHGQSQELAFVLFGQMSLRDGLSPQAHSFYHAKGLMEGLLALLKIEPSRYQWQPYDAQPETLHPGRSASLWIQNQRVAVIGEVSPIAQTQYDLGKIPVIVAQVDLKTLLSFKTSGTKLKAIPRFPVVTRDLALVVAQTLPYQQLVKTIKKAGKKLVDDVILFDLYQGGQLPAGQVSLAVRVMIQDEQKTLQEEEINQVMSAIKHALITECQVTLRS
jgi:phenylalanyl-tRNA synthetase beta chain